MHNAVMPIPSLIFKKKNQTRDCNTLQQISLSLPLPCMRFDIVKLIMRMVYARLHCNFHAFFLIFFFIIIFVLTNRIALCVRVFVCHAKVKQWQSLNSFAC